MADCLYCQADDLLQMTAYCLANKLSLLFVNYQTGDILAQAATVSPQDPNPQPWDNEISV